MQRPFLPFLIVALLAFGCRGSSNPPTGTGTGGDGGEPPAPALAENGDAGPSVFTNTDPGSIMDGTVEYTTQREVVRAMDMPELINALGKPKLSPSASDELAVRGSKSVQPLIEALDSDNPAIRKGAIFTLGLLEGEARAAAQAQRNRRRQQRRSPEPRRQVCDRRD